MDTKNGQIVSERFKAASPGQTLQTERLIFDQRLLEERDYWLGLLSGAITETSLRPDYPRPVRFSATMAATRISFESSLARRIEEMTGGAPILLYTTLLGAVGICLHKYTGSRTVIVGSPQRRH